MREYALSGDEGVALMCLAEALLRIPDNATRDALIRDKIGGGDWRAHLGHSPSLFVNAATWGLLVAGELTAARENTLARGLTRLLARGGEPVIRKAVDLAMRMMGEQFVTGQNIAEALAWPAKKMQVAGLPLFLRHAGRGSRDRGGRAQYFTAYAQAIHAIGAAAGPGDLRGAGHFHKAFGPAPALWPRPAGPGDGGAAAVPCARSPGWRGHYDIGLNIDAEEADRLDLSLDLLEALCLDPAWRAGTGSASWCRPIRSAPLRAGFSHRPRAAHRPPADGPAGERRLLGQRDQARADRRAGRVSGLHAQNPYRYFLPRLRAEIAGGARMRSSRNSPPITR